VLASCLFSAVAFRSEWSAHGPDVNDHVFHFAMIQRVAEVWEAGGNPRDPWIPYWGGGFPVLRYYQHLPHVGVVWIHRLLGQGIALRDVFEAVHFAAIVLLPFAYYVGARWLGMARHSAALLALCVPLLAVDGGQRYFFGLQPHSFLRLGSGLFSQQIAALFLPLALGALQRASLTGRRYGPALTLLSATWLSHLLLGYSACLLGVLAVLRSEARGQRLAVARRLAGLYAATFAVTLYLLLPSLLESALLWRSVWEEPVYWDSYGAPFVLRAFATGGLLDGARLPVLTALALGGLLWAAWPGGRERGARRFAGLACVVALLLYFGRPTWGAALEILPFSRNLPFHRFICAVQFTALLLAGLCLGELWRRLRWQHTPARAAAALASTLLCLAPAFASTWRLGEASGRFANASAEAFARDGSALTDALAIFAELDAKQAGRGYAGTAWDWGKEYLLAYTPVYMYWFAQDLPAISYMFHTMGINSELEVEFDPTRPDHYALFDVRYHVTHDPERVPAFGRVVTSRPGVIASLVEGPSYFDVVAVDRVFDATLHTRRALLALSRRFIASHWHAARRFAHIRWRADEPRREGELEIGSGEPFADEALRGWQPPRGRVVASSGRHDDFRAQVELEEPAALLLRVTYHPDWEARVDGRRVETLMLSPSYLGIPVEAGSHQVEVRWSPGRRSVWLFRASLAIVAGAFLLDGWRHGFHFRRG
jgi:hypothetical protein